MKKNRKIFLLALGLGFTFLISTALGLSFSQEEGQGQEKRYGLDETYNHVHDGVRLILAYHRASFSFIGSVENITDKAIKKVRVEIQLSNGEELGPTGPNSLDPGEKAGVKIDAAGQVFEWWKAQLLSRSGNKSLSLD